MRYLLKFVVLLAALVWMAGGAAAGPFEDGKAAYDRKDYSTALKLWRPLAEQGHARAQMRLGYLYRDGVGVPQDSVEAMKWYRKAAKQGLAVAQSNLGLMYANGTGVPQDFGEAMKWYRKAAKQGLAVAQANLGLMYYSGTGVLQDYVQGHMWFNIAAAQGDKSAMKYRNQSIKFMTREQIAEAQKMAREWVVTHPQ